MAVNKSSQLFQALNPHFPPNQVKALFAGIPKVLAARLTAAQTVNNSTTMVNTALSVDLESGKKYALRLVLPATVPVTNGIKLDFDGGTATATSFFAAARYYAGATAVESDVVTAIATDLATVVAASFIEIDGFIDVNQGGPLILRFAQQVATGDTILGVNGHLIATELL